MMLTTYSVWLLICFVFAPVCGSQYSLDHLDPNIVPQKNLTELLEAFHNRIDGGWSNWSAWGSCSSTCNGGMMSRLRTCDNPKPSLLGRSCDGNNEQINTCNTHTCAVSVPFVAFTAERPADGPSNETITFMDVKLNIGGGFDKSTGKFTCPIAGYYYFDVHLLTSFETTLARCFINRNKWNMAWAGVSVAYPARQGSYVASNSVVMHLGHGDEVYLAQCKPAANIGLYSTFTGFLMKSD